MTHNIVTILGNSIRNEIVNNIADILINKRNKDIANNMDYILAKMLARDRWAHSTIPNLTFGAICHFVSGSPVAV